MSNLVTLYFYIHHIHQPQTELSCNSRHIRRGLMKVKSDAQGNSMNIVKWQLSEENEYTFFIFLSFYHLALFLWFFRSLCKLSPTTFLPPYLAATEFDHPANNCHSLQLIKYSKFSISTMFLLDNCSCYDVIKTMADLKRVHYESGEFRGLARM